MWDCESKITVLVWWSTTILDEMNFHFIYTLNDDLKVIYKVLQVKSQQTHIECEQDEIYHFIKPL